MDKKSTLVVAMLFILVVVGSIVFTIMTVINSDKIAIGNGANIIKEEIVKTEQSIDDGTLDLDNITASKDKNKNTNTTNSVKDKNKDKDKVSNSTDKTTVEPVIPNQENISNNSGNSVNSQIPTTSQNTTVNNDKTNNNQDNSGNGGVNVTPSVPEPTPEEQPQEPTIIIKNSIFALNPASQNYVDGMVLRQEGTNIYVEGTIYKDGIVKVPILIVSPESYPSDLLNIRYQVGTAQPRILNASNVQKLSDGTPVIPIAIEYINNSSINISARWVNGGDVNYTVFFNMNVISSLIEE